MNEIKDLMFEIRIRDKGTGKVYTQMNAGGIPVQLEDENNGYEFLLTHETDSPNITVVRALNNLIAVLFKALYPYEDFQKFGEFSLNIKKGLKEYCESAIKAETK